MEEWNDSFLNQSFAIWTFFVKIKGGLGSAEDA